VYKRQVFFVEPAGLGARAQARSPAPSPPISGVPKERTDRSRRSDMCGNRASLRGRDVTLSNSSTTRYLRRLWYRRIQCSVSAGARWSIRPVSYTHLDVYKRQVIQGRAGGRIYERTADGVEHDWGEVTVWGPPTQLGYLWYLRQDRADASEVDIRFVALGANATRVEIEHGGWERLGAAGEELSLIHI